MFNVRLAGGKLYGKQLFTWLSLVMSLMASFVLSFYPLDVGAGGGCLDIFYSHLSFSLLFLPLFGRRPDID